jgi:hypothetical protein
MIQGVRVQTTEGKDSGWGVEELKAYRRLSLRTRARVVAGVYVGLASSPKAAWAAFKTPIQMAYMALGILSALSVLAWLFYEKMTFVAYPIPNMYYFVIVVYLWLNGLLLAVGASMGIRFPPKAEKETGPTWIFAPMPSPKPKFLKRAGAIIVDILVCFGRQTLAWSEERMGEWVVKGVGPIGWIQESHNGLVRAAATKEGFFMAAEIEELSRAAGRGKSAGSTRARL